jgi:hypothetical protein
MQKLLETPSATRRDHFALGKTSDRALRVNQPEIRNREDV